MLSAQHNTAMNVVLTSRGVSFIPYTPVGMEKLREIVRKLNQECFSRKIQLRRQIYESEEELQAMNEELNIATAEVGEIEATRDAWNAELELAKYKNFWKRVHRKHIMEDLTDLKKHQKDCCNYSKDILLRNVKETSGGQNNSFWRRTKKFFANLLPQSTSALRRKEGRSCRDEKFKEIISDLEDGAKVVDELVVADYCSYFRQQWRNKD